MNQDYHNIISFIVELEKLKNVSRKIKPPGLTRYENSAEHSWQIALLALSLLPYASQPLDATKVVSMLLLHDIVEIDTGDKFAYADNHEDYENEHKAAVRIFGMLPQQVGDSFLKTWEEFEAAESAEARFAKGIDRIMPVIQNLNNGCQSWLEHGISISQILHKNRVAADTNPELWDIVSSMVKEQGKAAGLNG